MSLTADLGVQAGEADRRTLDQWLEVRILGGRVRICDVLVDRERTNLGALG